MSKEKTQVTKYPSRKQIRENRKARLHGIMKMSFFSIFALAMLGVGFGTSMAYPHKTVYLNVDGKTEKISTWGQKVEDVLAEKSIAVKEQDEVLPSMTSDVKSGDTVVVNEAKEVSIVVDGKSKDVWTTASSADEIIDEFSNKDSNVTVAARSSFRDGTDHDIVAKKSKIKVVHDGKEEYVYVLPDETSKEILQKLNISTSPIDKVTLTKEKNETVLTVQRVERGYESKTEKIKFETKIEKDPNLPAGEQKKEQEGKEGEKEISAYFEKIDGNVVHQGTVTETVKSEPTEEIIKLGVKGIDASRLPDDPDKLRDLVTRGGLDIPNVNTNYTGEDPRALALPLVTGMGWGEGEYRCLIALWQKESNWNPNAYNASSGATGIPQALPGSKMASAGADWRTNPVTQIRWGLGYIAGRYGTPCGAWGHSQARGWY